MDWNPNSIIGINQIFIIGIDQYDKVIDIASSLGYKLVEVRKDLASIPRVVTFKI